ncbi:MAG: helix-turn-helix domain-containing protein [Candidatus Aenigmatarchaeota archaeon]
MGRKAGYNPKTIASLMAILASKPEGLWLRRLAKEAGLHPSTVSKYLAGPLKPFIESSSLGAPGEKPLLIVVRLKPVVLQRLAEGASIADIMKLLSLIETASK